MPDPESKPPQVPAWGIGLLVLGGILVGLGIYQAVTGNAPQPASAQPAMTSTVAVEKTSFEKSIRIGGTVGAMNFAMIRAPQMRGGRDRGGGSGLTIQTLAEAGTVVQAGDVVAEFESKNTQDQMDTYSSMLAQTRALTATRKAEMLIATETLRQNFRTTKAEAEKAAFDLQTAEVRSAIQAEIFRLLAEEGTASSEQLEQEVQLQEMADAAERRSLDITVEQDRKRLDRTEFDFDKMRLRTPVGGLVVIETMFSRGSFQQASPGDQVYGGAYFMRIVDLSSMAVYAELNQADSQIVELGAPVVVRLDAYPTASSKAASRTLAPWPLRAAPAAAVAGLPARAAREVTGSRRCRSWSRSWIPTSASSPIFPQASMSSSRSRKTLWSFRGPPSPKLGARRWYGCKTAAHSSCAKSSSAR